MKRYNDYMDNLEVSDTLHQRLTELEAPKKRPAAWRKYGAAAAALVLVAGAGVWGLGRMIGHTATVKPEVPAIGTVNPERAEIPAPYPMPDIATVNPNDPHAPTDSTNGGYEIVDGDMTQYLFLPYLNWADASALTQTSMDYSLAPLDAVQRDATWDDVQIFAGGEKAMADHLLWDEGMNWNGTLWFLEDGTPCGASFGTGWANYTRLYLEVMRDHEVPSCVVFPDEYYETSQWQGVKITALKNVGYTVEDGVKLFQWVVSLYSNGVGYKLTLWTDDEQRANELCARFVRYAVNGGFSLSVLSYRAGDLPNKGLPPEDDSNYSVGEPRWEDRVPDFVPDYDPTYEDSAPQTTPYAPSATN